MSFKFEVIDRFGRVVMHTGVPKYIPEKSIIQHQYKAGYKFKYNNKFINLKQIEELRKSIK